MNSLRNPHYKLQEHRITNEDSFHPHTSQFSLFNKKTSVCHNALKLKQYLYGKKYNHQWVPYRQITALIQSLNCHMLCSKQSASSLPRLSRNNYALQLPSWAFEMFHKGLVPSTWWKRTSHHHGPCKLTQFLFVRPNVEKE